MAEKEAQKDEAQKKASTDVEGVLRSVLRAPRISEKAGELAKSGKYVFVVSPRTNKVEVKKAIERAYKVSVAKVNMVNRSGKLRKNARATYRQTAVRKAIVTLKKGQTLPGFSDLA
jgi:large subunit ribosomal protein L23